LRAAAPYEVPFSTLLSAGAILLTSSNATAMLQEQE
jgi:hypothetical protein